MRTLYEGLTGPDVYSWQVFLRGWKSNSHIVASSTFDDVTKSETKEFQLAKSAFPDGVVGPKTLAFAMLAGFDPTVDDRSERSSASWPRKPAGLMPLDPVSREKLFGRFAYVASPTPVNPEAITLTDDWTSKNLVVVNVPQLKNVQYAPKDQNVLIHRSIGPQFKKVWSDWESAGLVDRVLVWGGSWAPRFIRGSRTALSNHAWATAFDINTPWNMLGAQGALYGQRGCVRELVDIAVDNGFFWGGWFEPRRDAMHFEAMSVK